jgi:hypothetical protein
MDNTIYLSNDLADLPQNPVGVNRLLWPKDQRALQTGIFANIGFVQVFMAKSRGFVFGLLWCNSHKLFFNGKNQDDGNIQAIAYDIQMKISGTILIALLDQGDQFTHFKVLFNA